MTPAARKRRGALALALTALASVLAAVGIGVVQPSLARDAHTVKQRDDVFLLPPPRELRAMSLGYLATMADILWAKLMVEYGVHWQEKRAFPDVTRYLDGILAVEPDFPLVYQFADTILLFTPVGATDEDARVARRYLERGLRERPYDPETWRHYGQFVAFLAPSWLKDPSEIEAWRKDGAEALARAVELGADADRSLAASTILSKAGETQAAVQHLQRAYAMTDDPETRRQILIKLARLQASFEAEGALTVVERHWRTRYGFLSRGETLLVGPYRDAAACAGTSSYEDPACPRDWSSLVESSRR